MPIDDRSRKVREIVDSFAHFLLSTDPIKTNPLEINAAFAKYKQDLLDAGTTEEEVKDFLSISFLSMSTDSIQSFPMNHVDLANVLVRQLMVENQMRKFLMLRSPGINWHSDKLPFAGLCDLCVDLAPSVGRKQFNAGLQELGRIRNLYAHNLDYSIKEKNVEGMRAFLKHYHKHYKDYGHMEPLEVYYEYCHSAYAYFYGAAWYYREKLESEPS